MFSDFGGKSGDFPSSLYDNLDREFQEETMDQFALNFDQLTQKSTLLFKISDVTGYPVWYLLYPFDGLQVTKSLTLNSLRQNKEFTALLPSEKLEKDSFYWFKLDDLVSAEKNGKKKTTLKPLFVEEPPSVEVTLRPHFIKYFLKHPALQEWVSRVKVNYARENKRATAFN